MKRTRLRKLASIVTAASAALISLTAPVVSAPSAAAVDSCPANTPYNWYQSDYFHGVTVCQTTPPRSGHWITVQIVNFDLGAKIRIMSEPASGTVLGGPSTQFKTKTANQWYQWASTNVGTPASSKLVSAANGGFFRSYSSQSALSFPEKKWGTLTSSGEDPNAQKKRLFGLTDPRSGNQRAFITDWPADGLADATYANNNLAPYFDANVALHPQFGDTGAGRRTFVGLSNQARCWSCWQDRAYILTSDSDLTIDQARSILVNDFGSMLNIQMDGGGSTQLNVRGTDRIISNQFLVQRAVPEAILVYSG